jgi:hypothetical protein
VHASIRVEVRFSPAATALISTIRKVITTAALGLSVSSHAYAESLKPASPPQAIPGDMLFRIFDGDKAVGTLTVNVAGNDASRIVVTKSQLTIKRFLLTATVNRRTEEHWTNGQFISLSAEFNSAGTLGTTNKKLDVNRNADGTLTAVANTKIHSLPANAVPMTLWGPPVLHDGVFFNATDGGKTSVTITSGIHERQIVTFQDRTCEAKQVQTDGQEKDKFEIWLDFDGTLCGLHQKSALADLRYIRETNINASK